MSATSPVCQGRSLRVHGLQWESGLQWERHRLQCWLWEMARLSEAQAHQLMQRYWASPQWELGLL